MQFDIKNVITSINTVNEISLVTVYNLPNNAESFAKVFECLAENGVNVDMISLCPSSGLHQTASFSANDSDLVSILSTVGFFKNTYPELRMDISSKNTKLTFAGDGMRERCGVAAFVFNAFASKNIPIKLITTSETKISCLTDESNFMQVCQLLEEFFDVKSV